MKSKVLAVVIAVTMMLTACDFDDVTTSEIAVAETTAETTVSGPVRDGNYIYFGSYYERNGKPGPIEWKILKEDDGKLLIISAGILDFQPYNTERADVTWETCSLRRWLNEDFINAAFNASEQQYILTTTISNPDNAEYGTKGGNDTEDKVFLLSIDEAQTFFADNQSRTSSDKWWLRSPGKAPDGAANVASDGWATSGGYIDDVWRVDSEFGVRPVLWIKFDNSEYSTAQESNTVKTDEETLQTEIVSSFSNLQVGQTITFGYFEQDNNIDNGSEPIEWEVLDVKEGKALIISKYSLVHKKYHGSWANVNWKTCSLRKWLNGDFLEVAFGSYDQKMIVSTTVILDEDLEGIKQDNNTTDKVFLLSVSEANKYFRSESARICYETPYCMAEGKKGDYNVELKAWWWLRSSKETSDAPFVKYDGSVDAKGRYVDNQTFAVRPAMWIYLND